MMKKNFLFFAVLFFSSVLISGAESTHAARKNVKTQIQKNAPGSVRLTAEQKQTIHRLNGDFMNFYRSPDPSKIAGMLRTLNEIPEDAAGKIFSSAIVFFGEVYRKNPAMLSSWTKIGEDKRHMRFLSINALLYAGTTDAKKELDSYMKRNAKNLQNLQLPKTNFTDISKFKMTHPSMLDACWGGYFATGDAKYPEAVLKCAIRPVKNGTVDLTSLAAKWSSVSIAKQNGDIKKILRNFLSKRTRAEQKRFWKNFPDEVQQTIGGKIVYPMADQKKDYESFKKQNPGVKTTTLSPRKIQ